MDSELANKPCEICGNSFIVPYNYSGALTYRIVKCIECGLIYADVIVSSYDYRKVSSKDPLVFRDPAMLKERELPRLRNVLGEIQAYKKRWGEIVRHWMRAWVFTQFVKRVRI